MKMWGHVSVRGGGQIILRMSENRFVEGTTHAALASADYLSAVLSCSVKASSI
jgi:hypothetical protein